MAKPSKIFEIKLTDNNDQETMCAMINVGRDTTPEMLDDMINAFEQMREGLYEKARYNVKMYDQARKEVQDA